VSRVAPSVVERCPGAAVGAAPWPAGAGGDPGQGRDGTGGQRPPLADRGRGRDTLPTTSWAGTVAFSTPAPRPATIAHLR